jgi:phage repressor protein C with HTH and peptisase S24 domain
VKKNHIKNQISSNLKYLREKAGISQAYLANDLDLNRDNISSYERGTEPPITNLIKLVNYFHVAIADIIHKDLTATKDEKYVTQDVENYIVEEKHTFGFISDSKHNIQRIPLFNIESTAGLVPLFLNRNNMKPEGYINVPNLPKCDGAVHVTGDSMYPLLKSGDIVLYKQITDVENNIFWGEMYLISLDMEGEEYITVKYIQRGDKQDHIKLVSHNHNHSDKEVHMSKILALAFVKASIRINSMK